MSRKKQLTSLRNAIFDALGDAVDIKGIMNSLGVLSTGDVRTLRNKLKTTKDAISVLKQYRSISKFLDSLTMNTGSISYGSYYTKPEGRTKNTTLSALSSFYKMQGAVARGTLRGKQDFRRSTPFPSKVSNISGKGSPVYVDIDPASRSEDYNNLIESFRSGTSILSQQGQSRLKEQRELKDRARSFTPEQEKGLQSNLAARQSYSDFMRSHIDPRRYRLAQLAHSFYEEPIPSTLQERVDFKAGKWDYEEKRKEARKAAMDKAKKALAAETQNTKSVNENTKALTGLRAFLGPYAKLAMPFYAAKMLYQTGGASTDASLERVQRRTFGGLYGASRDIRGYRRMFNAMTSYGASEKDVMREYSGQKKWASTLMFGMGLDKIEALAMILGKAPGPAEMRDPELMQRWLRENMRGITDMQAMQLSAMGVASDAFIESARKGQAVDIEGRTATARETYDVLGKQTGNPLKKLGYKVAADQAYAIEAASSGNAGKAFSIAALGSNYRLYDQAIESERAREKNYDESIELIPRQTNVTVNINGNIDSEERAHSFAEQIGDEVSNAEK